MAVHLETYLLGFTAAMPTAMCLRERSANSVEKCHCWFILSLLLFLDLPRSPTSVWVDVACRLRITVRGNI